MDLTTNGRTEKVIYRNSFVLLKSVDISKIGSRMMFDGEELKRIKGATRINRPS